MAETRKGTRTKPTAEAVKKLIADATDVLMDVRTNAPVGYLDDDTAREKLQKQLADATRLVNDAGIAQMTLNPNGAQTALWRAWQDLMDLDGNVQADFYAGFLPRPETDPTGIPGKDPDLETEDDYTADEADET